MEAKQFSGKIIRDSCPFSFDERNPMMSAEADDDEYECSECGCCFDADAPEEGAEEFVWHPKRKF